MYNIHYEFKLHMNDCKTDVTNIMCKYDIFNLDHFVIIIIICELCVDQNMLEIKVYI